MNLLSSELPFHVHNWLIISLNDFCIVIRKWPTFWPSRCLITEYRPTSTIIYTIILDYTMILVHLHIPQ